MIDGPVLKGWKLKAWSQFTGKCEPVAHTFMNPLPLWTPRWDWEVWLPHHEGSASFRWRSVLPVLRHTALSQSWNGSPFEMCIQSTGERKRQLFGHFFLHLQLKCISLTQACIHTFLWKEAETKRLKLFLLLSSATSVFCLESQLVQFGIFFLTH